VAYHRWFFAVLNKTWANQSYFKSVDHLRHALLLRLGYVERIHLKGGAEVQIPMSMSFSKMSREEFDAFATQCINFICEEVLVHMEPNMLRAEIENMVGIQ